ncbi:SANT/Myb_domain [Hexamita inflata]|uniref:SANT/Myb domain n=1 Tax=Hexamita inflata TaxID=28002 RepID=A0AA86PNZ6_9EUKA|nr:SANT/Myb domain [Hexamita inflata]
MHTNQRWTETEDIEFRKLINRYQNDFMLIAERMDKSYNQVRSHYYNVQKRQRNLKTKLISQENIKTNQSKENLTESKYKLIVFELIQ